MASNEKVKLDMTLSADDKFTTSFNKLAKKVEGIQAKIEKLGGSKVGKALSGLSEKFGKVSEKAGALGGVLGGIAGFGGAAAGGLVALTVKVSDATREIDRFATFAGVGKERMQELMYAGQLVGLESEELAMQMGALAERVVDANDGNEEFIEIFKAMNVSIKDSQGNIRSTDAVLMELADTFSQMEDGPVKSTIAIKLFGDAGAKMLPMLDEGSAGMKAMAQEAQDLGLVLNDSAINESNKFREQLSKLMAMIDSVVMVIGTAFMPAITQLIMTFSGWIQANKSLISIKITEWAQAFADVLPSIIEGVSGFFVGLSNLIGGIASFIEFIGGAQNFVYVLATVMGGPLLIALAGAAKGFLVLGAAILTTPIGWIILGIMGLVTAIAAIFPKVRKFFMNLIPDWIVDLFGGKKEVDVEFNAAVDDEELAKLEEMQRELDNKNKPKDPGGSSPDPIDFDPSDYDPTKFPKDYPPPYDPKDYPSPYGAQSYSTPYKAHDYSSTPSPTYPPTGGGGASVPTPQSVFAPSIPMPATNQHTQAITQRIEETKIEDVRIRLILPPGVSATGHENSSKVSVDISSLGYQNGWS